MAAVRVGWLLLRAGGRASASVLAMAVVCSAVSTALLLLVVGGYDALSDRGDRTAWRAPQSVTATEAVAVVGSAVQSVDGAPLTVVDVAELPGRRLIPPAGLERVPAPGEVWTSPALAALLDELPAGRLADRFDGLRRAGTVGPQALVSPSELVAVVGRDAGDPLVDPRAEHVVETPSIRSPAFVAVLPTAAADAAGGSFAGSGLYLGLALCAMALLVLPLTTLGAAAARLGVSRRDQRLAAMRLVGATSRQVTALTAGEAAAAAVVGVLVGTALHAAVLAPIATRIQLQQNPFTWAEVWPTGWHLPAVAAAVVLLGVAGAVLGLRRVRISPLGVVARVTPPGVRAVRAVVVVVAFVVWSAVATKAFGAGLVVVAAGTLLVFGTISLVGPWVVWILGRVLVAGSRGTAGLPAGRRLMDDPRGAWRTVGGLALAGFVAAGLSVFPALEASGAFGGSTDVVVALPVGADAAAAGTEVAAEVQQRLAGTGVPVEVTASDGAGEPSEVRVDVAGGEGTPEQVDLVVTALAGLPATGATAEAVVRSAADDAAVDQRVMDDIGTGSLLTLAIVFVVAAVSAGLSQAAVVLDTRRQLQLLTLAGTPGRVLRRARRRQVLVPLLVTLSTSVGLGLLFVLPLAGTQLLTRPEGLVQLVTCLAAGVAAVALAVEASTPLLRRVSARLPEATG